MNILFKSDYMTGFQQVVKDWCLEGVVPVLEYSDGHIDRSSMKRVILKKQAEG